MRREINVMYTTAVRAHALAAVIVHETHLLLTPELAHLPNWGKHPGWTQASYEMHVLVQKRARQAGTLP